MELNRKLIMIIILLIINETISFASGYLFINQGSRANGMAGAFVATANDASSIFYNPAGMSFINSQQFLINANIYYQRGSFEGNNPITNTNISENLRGGTFLSPNAYYVKPINDKFTAGIGLFNIFNYDIEWEEKEKFNGRFIAQRTSLSAWSINPALSYHISPQLGIGFGIELREIKFMYEKSIPLLIQQYDAIFDVAHLKIESKREWGVSFNIGAMYEMRDDIRIGLSYRHSIEKDLGTEAEFNVLPMSNIPLDEKGGPSFPQEPVSVKVNVFFPTILTIGAAYQYDETLLMELDISWERWNKFNELRFIFNDYSVYDTVIKKDYKDSFSIRLGLEKELNSTYKIQAGYAFEKTPVSSSGADPLYWDANRHNLSCGINIRNKNMIMNIYNSVLLHQKISTNNMSQFAFNGSYKKLINILGIAVSYSW